MMVTLVLKPSLNAYVFSPVTLITYMQMWLS